MDVMRRPTRTVAVLMLLAAGSGTPPSRRSWPPSSR